MTGSSKFQGQVNDSRRLISRPQTPLDGGRPRHGRDALPGRSRGSGDQSRNSGTGLPHARHLLKRSEARIGIGTADSRPAVERPPRPLLLHRYSTRGLDRIQLGDLWFLASFCWFRFLGQTNVAKNASVSLELSLIQGRRSFTFTVPTAVPAMKTGTASPGR